MSMSGLPPVEENNVLPDLNDDVKEEVLTITIRENDDDSSVEDVEFSGEGLDVTDRGDVLSALIFAIRAVEPDTETLIETFRMLDEIRDGQ